MLITNLEHFLAPDGSIGPKDGPAFRLAEDLTKIIVVATALIQTPSETMIIRCWRRPNRKPCVGFIQTDIESEMNQIIWWCQICEELGSINHWQGSLMDCTNNAQLH